MGVKNGPRLVGWVWPGPDCRPMNHGLDDFVSSCCKGFLHNVSQILWEFKINMRRKCFLYSCLRIIHFYFFVHLCCHSVSILWTWWNFKNHLYSIRHLWLNSLTWFLSPSETLCMMKTIIFMSLCFLESIHCIYLLIIKLFFSWKFIWMGKKNKKVLEF